MLFKIFCIVYLKKISIGKYIATSTNNPKPFFVDVPHQDKKQKQKNWKFYQFTNTIRQCWILFIFRHEIISIYRFWLAISSIQCHCIQSNANVKYFIIIFFQLICSISSFFFSYFLYFFKKKLSILLFLLIVFVWFYLNCFFMFVFKLIFNHNINLHTYRFAVFAHSIIYETYFRIRLF